MMLRFVIAFLLGLASAQAQIIGVVVGAESGQVRYVIIPDKDEQLAGVKVRKGERLLLMDRKAEITAEVERQIGKKPTVARAAVVEPDGTVSAVIAADPLIDALPGKELVTDDAGVKAGDKYDRDGAVFTDADGVVKAPREPEPMPAQTVDDMLKAAR